MPEVTQLVMARPRYEPRQSDFRVGVLSTTQCPARSGIFSQMVAWLTLFRHLFKNHIFGKVSPDCPVLVPLYLLPRIIFLHHFIIVLSQTLLIPFCLPRMISECKLHLGKTCLGRHACLIDSGMAASQLAWRGHSTVKSNSLI